MFQCRVGGEPLPDVLWRRSAAGGNMPLGRVHILEDRSLRIDDITIDDMGEYICEADNAAGSVISSGILTVQCNIIVIKTNNYIFFNALIFTIQHLQLSR